MAVDILPASIPLDASQHFSKALLPYLTTLICEYRSEPVNNGYAQSLGRATVARHGELMKNHRWLAEPVMAWRESVELQSSGSPEHIMNANAGSAGAIVRDMVGVKSKKKVLMLGSGMVAGPAVDEICRRSDVKLLVGSYHIF